ncbi:ABC transporter substrate-binding protein [Telluria mixta]|uniref:Probable sugar-binding periplasmic protein n=1 Tax=Telluria mixta TaxID=34071 RepID=A0ABT2BSF3_9BURK|nr:ABC transporter substrate-binding protein [Telluria mixta]MCS0628048.1 ABC transporter substrate-binding protein [Telluria mixta]WEM93835.1 ABC transporter substrate-binding protein [Telluria mixta]
MTVSHVFAALAAGLALCASTTARAGDLEVFHYWDLAGDARAIAFLKATLTQEGDTWRDFAVAGGGTGMALTLLKSRVAAGNPPTAAQMKAPAIAAWAQAGHLANLDDIARAGQWDKVLPEAISARMKYNGHYVAVPVDLHRNNWLWINARVLKASRAKAPTTWDEFFRTAEAMKRAGFIAVAHGEQPWEDLRLFENVVIGLAGADFYRKALVQLDTAALSSPAMERALATFRRIKSYTGRSTYQNDWIQASAMLTSGKAGMQFMGDWNKPVLMEARKTSDFEFECLPVPGATDAFVFDVDSFVMFKVQGEAKLGAQRHLAAALLRPDIQERFNLYKGALPVRSDVDLGRYDRCATASRAAFQQAARSGVLVPSINMAQPPPVEDAMRAFISDFWRDDRVTAATTIARLKALAASR